MQKPTISERGIYPNHTDRYWEFSNTENRREIVKKYSKIKYTEEQARNHFRRTTDSYSEK